MKQRLITFLAVLCAVIMTGCSNQASGETTENKLAPTAETETDGTGETEAMPSAETLPLEEGDIGSDTAKAIALEDAKLTEGSVDFIKANIDYDDGRKVYDVEFYNGNTEYDYEIDASTGDIISHDYETESYDRTLESTPDASAGKAYNSTSAKRSGKTSKNTSNNSTDKTSKNTSNNNTNKTSKNTSNKSTDKTSKNTSNSSTGKTSKNTSKSNAGKVTLAQAKKIALKKAGLSENDGYWNKEKTDRDDGRTVYELEFISGDTEYEFEIDAKKGNILEYDKESIHD